MNLVTLFLLCNEKKVVLNDSNYIVREEQEIHLDQVGGKIISDSKK